MFKRVVRVLILVLTLLASVGVRKAVADQPLVGVFLFSPSESASCEQAPASVYGSASDCNVCQLEESSCVPDLPAEVADHVQVRVFDPLQPQDYQVLLGLEEARGVQVRQMPALFIGDTVLVGEDAIRAQYRDLVVQCVADGGCPFPAGAEPSRVPLLPSMAPPPLLLKEAPPSTPGVTDYKGTEPPRPDSLLSAYSVQTLYFYRGSNWENEEWSWFLLRYFLEERMNVTLRAFDVDVADNETVRRQLCAHYGVSDTQATPAVFVGAYALVGDEISLPPLIEAWKTYSEEMMLSPLQLMAQDDPEPDSAASPAAPQGTGQATAEPEQELVAHVVFFHSPTCPHCRIVEDEVLPPLEATYGSQLEVVALNVQDPDDYDVLMDLEGRYGVHVAEVPVVFVGDAVLEGEPAIRNGLETQIERCLQGGGCPSPIARAPGGASPAAGEVAPAPVEEDLGDGVTVYRGTGTEGAGQPQVQMAYFFEQGCQECDRAWLDLSHLLSQHADVTVRVYDIGAPDNKVLNEALCSQYDVPEEKHLSTPALFVGERCLLGDEITAQRIDAAYQAVSGQDVAAPWDLVSGSTHQARERILDRFRSFGPYTVVAAGLIDGLNPCAFATIIFFVSYLAIAGHKGREVLSVGASFTLGVFMTYLLVGVGLWRLLQTVGFLTALGRWVYLATALLCLGLAAFSILDYRKARRGELGDMTLSLPHSMRMRINRIIRGTRGVRAYAAVAFTTGLLVSVIELACTGQVYLPTIIFVMGVPELRTRGFLFLLLYNLAFILPLVVIFILVFRGTTSRQLTRFLQSRAATVKLAMSALFVTLAGWLLYAVFGG